MKEMPEYAETLITAIKYKGKFCWYVSNKSFWYLDLRKFTLAMLRVQKATEEDLEDYSERCNIDIVNEHRAEEFIRAMEEYRVETEELRAWIVDNKLETIEELWDVVPVILVDFDQKTLWTQYPEMIAFERYVPEGWEGKYEEFWDQVPKNERYWLVGEEDYMNWEGRRSGSEFDIEETADSDGKL